MKALIENIQHYSLHDGPGIRTTVFFKGCPLRCRWCSNPPTHNRGRVLLKKPNECRGGGLCATLCPRDAIKGVCGPPRVDRARCDACGLCAASCRGKALLMAGQEYSLDEVFGRIRKDMLFYRNSGGGVTLSGGEVLAQHAFAVELCGRCAALGIHTAIETSGFAPYEHFRALALVADVIFYDIKHLDPARHKELTGQDNALILANLERFLAETDKSVHIRLPLVPGLNDDAAHLEAYGAYLAGLPGVPERADLEVLPYHRLGKDKYAMLGREYGLGDTPPMPRAEAEAAVRLLRGRAGDLKVFCAA